MFQINIACIVLPGHKQLDITRLASKDAKTEFLIYINLIGISIFKNKNSLTSSKSLQISQPSPISTLQSNIPETCVSSPSPSPPSWRPSSALAYLCSRVMLSPPTLLAWDLTHLVVPSRGQAKLDSKFLLPLLLVCKEGFDDLLSLQGLLRK